MFWDNAYCEHHLYEEHDELADILAACEAAGNPDLVYEFCSTSKMTLPGSGVSALATSRDNLADLKATLTVQMIGHDKINQLRHVRFFGDVEGLRAHMQAHARILRPRFELVERRLTEGLGELGVASWSHPRGGYFVSFDGPEGSAKAIVRLADECGVKLTAAGSTWPHGQDPARLQHPHRAELPLPRGARPGAGGVRDVRQARERPPCAPAARARRGERPMSAASSNAGTGAAVETKAAAQAGLDEQGERVRGIFSKIARRYELFNALSSLGIYRHWLNVVARHAACSPTDRVLDVAGGAGDVAFTLARRCPPASIELTDFCQEMLDVAQTRIEAGEGRGVPVRTSIADAMDLPYDDASFDVLTVAYGLRNFSDRVRSMREALRVLRPGGTYVAPGVLHAGQPRVAGALRLLPGPRHPAGGRRAHP